MCKRRSTLCSAVLLQAKNGGDGPVCANVYGLCWSGFSGHDGMRCALFLIKWAVLRRLFCSIGLESAGFDRSMHRRPCVCGSGLQMLVKKFRAGGAGGDPMTVQKEVVDAIGKDELLKLDVLLAQCRRQLHRL